MPSGGPHYRGTYYSRCGLPVPVCTEAFAAAAAAADAPCAAAAAVKENPGAAAADLLLSLRCSAVGQEQQELMRKHSQLTMHQMGCAAAAVGGAPEE